MMQLPLQRQPLHRAGLAAATFYARHALVLAVLAALCFGIAVWQHWVHFSVTGLRKYLWAMTGLLMIAWPLVAAGELWRQCRLARPGTREVLAALLALGLIALLTAFAWQQLEAGLA
jgi:hypothetical protein